MISEVGAVAAAGDHDRALRLAGDAERQAREITDPERRADALRSLADMLVNDPASRTNESDARRLIAEVLGSSFWQTALGLVARIEAPALLAVCDALLVDLARQRLW